MAKRKKKTKKEAEKAPETKGSEMPEEFSDSTWLVNYVIAAKKQAENASKERRIKWAELWLLFQNKQDYTGKKSWQSKIFTPKIFMHTLRGSSLVERAVLQTSTLFKVEIDEEEYDEGEHEAAREKARKVEKKLKSHLNKTNFAETYGEGTISTFLLGLGAVKRYWEEEEDQEKCKYENTDVLNLFISPDFMPSVHRRPPYMIERKVMKLADLLTLIEKTPDVYITDAVDKLETAYATKQEIKTKERTRRGLSDYSPQDKKVEIFEFWGDIISEDGKHVLRDQLLMVANETELIRHHENSHDDKLPPYRLTIPIVYPHRGIAGTSLVEGAVPLQYTLNNLINLYMDNLNFTVNKMFEVEKTGLVDPQKMPRIYPGKIFLKSVERRVVQEVGVTAVGAEVINAIKVVDSELRQATAITEYVEALPSKHKQTLGEIEKKTAEAHSFFDVIARRLERNSIGPLIEDTYNLLVQFSDTLKGLEGKYIFKVGGLTLLLQEEKLKQSIEATLAAVAKGGIFAEMTDVPLLWKKWLTHLNLQDAFKEPPEEAEVGAEGKTPADAEAKARQDVRNLPPEEQIRLLNTLRAA